MSRFLLVLVLTGCCFGAATQPAADPLRRQDPESAVTAFIETCHQQDYTKASQYLDLSQIPASSRAKEGPQLAKDLEALLNADHSFDPLTLGHPEGLSQGLVTVATVKKGDQSYPLQLTLEKAIWVFSPQTVGLLPKLAPLPSAESQIAARLPRFLVATEIAETPLWIWLTLLIAGIGIAAVVRLVATISMRMLTGTRWRGVHTWLEPALMFVAALCFRVAEEELVPSAFARLFLQRFLLLVVVWAVAWALINVIELFLSRLDSILNPRQRMVSHSLIYLARRTTRVVIVLFAAVFVLDGWGFPMTTIIAGLGVSGIAVALAAQQTIANVFGGVSVIGDHPVLVNDFGNFGGVIGTIEDIGLRSTRVRTLSRTVVSIPNSSFAGMNLENYSERDKILFNPTLSVKRGTPKAQIEKAMDSIGAMLRDDKRVETGTAALRITALSAAAFSVELFCYINTAEMNESYKVTSDLYLKIDDLLAGAGVELA